MATKKDADEAAEAPEEAAPKGKHGQLIQQAESLLHPPTGGYVQADEDFDRGVQAVIDLLRSDT